MLNINIHSFAPLVHWRSCHARFSLPFVRRFLRKLQTTQYDLYYFFSSIYGQRFLTNKYPLWIVMLCVCLCVFVIRTTIVPIACIRVYVSCFINWIRIALRFKHVSAITFLRPLHFVVGDAIYDGRFVLFFLFMAIFFQHPTLATPTSGEAWELAHARSLCRFVYVWLSRMDASMTEVKWRPRRGPSV